MKRTTSRSFSRLMIATQVAALLWLAAPGESFGQGRSKADARIAPPNSKPFGLTYAEWSVDWWKWALGIPAAENPLLDTTGEFADVEQSGPVWFLGGNFGGDTERTITVPPGKSLFFPVVNAAWWAPEDLEFAASIAEMLGLDPQLLSDEELLRVLANFSVNTTTEFALDIDGVPVDDPARYRAESPAFEIVDADLLEDIGYVPLDSRLAVSDGYWIMLRPLPAGEHTIQFSATNEFLGLQLRVTYHITVGR